MFSISRSHYLSRGYHRFYYNAICFRNTFRHKLFAFESFLWSQVVNEIHLTHCYVSESFRLNRQLSSNKDIALNPFNALFTQSFCLPLFVDKLNFVSFTFNFISKWQIITLNVNVESIIREKSPILVYNEMLIFLSRFFKIIGFNSNRVNRLSGELKSSS